MKITVKCPCCNEFFTIYMEYERNNAIIATDPLFELEERKILETLNIEFG
ncbi:hypothetical protein Elgi_36650 [Paenibacillus elgii]|nr:hypothetical protein Elgi_36650 [Paenibacillus elgii]